MSEGGANISEGTMAVRPRSGQAAPAVFSRPVAGADFLLRSDRLLLRPYHAGDEQALLRFIVENRSRLLPFLSEWALAVEDQAGAGRLIRAAQAGWRLGRMYLFGVWTREEHELAGELVLFNVDRQAAVAEIGYYAAAGCEGRGLICEAVNALLAAARDTFGLETVVARCAIDNGRSRRTAELCGFRPRSGESGEVCFTRALAIQPDVRRLPGGCSAHFETPVVISGARATIHGILSAPEGASRIVVLLPAPDGTREGPQRLFVEIARSLAHSGIASLRVDLTDTGDSLAAAPPVSEDGAYSDTLDSVAAFLEKREVAFAETILLTISYGSRAVMRYARANGLARIVLLSPSRVVSESRVVRKEILRAYAWKLFRWESWRKVLTLRFHPRRIAGNVLGALALRRVARVPPLAASRTGSATTPLAALCVFGEKDPAAEESRAFWSECIHRGGPAMMETVIVPGSDHSYFEWRFKVEVCAAVGKWLGAR